MKIALFIDEKRKQIVLTPQSEHERAILKLFKDMEYDYKIYQSQFYPTQGGWTKMSEAGYRGEENDSTIIVFDRKENKNNYKEGLDN